MEICRRLIDGNLLLLSEEWDVSMFKGKRAIVLAISRVAKRVSYCRRNMFSALNCILIIIKYPRIRVAQDHYFLILRDVIEYQKHIYYFFILAKFKAAIVTW